MNLRLLGSVAVVFVWASQAFAASRDDVLEAFGKCAAVSDDKARLACYDALAPHAKEALATPPTALSADRPPTKEEQESWFGFDLSGLFGSSPAAADHAAAIRERSAARNACQGAGNKTGGRQYHRRRHRIFLYAFWQVRRLSGQWPGLASGPGRRRPRHVSQERKGQQGHDLARAYRKLQSHDQRQRESLQG